ncbi:hypothetical protein DFH09DRAFT_1076687 [Mycena vulgaris]|nr:hypothetical protein DFH09DRAFT_1076687 [Mycena vulgaris]
MPFSRKFVTRTPKPLPQPGCEPRSPGICIILKSFLPDQSLSPPPSCLRCGAEDGGVFMRRCASTRVAGMRGYIVCVRELRAAWMGAACAHAGVAALRARARVLYVVVDPQACLPACRCRDVGAVCASFGCESSERARAECMRFVGGLRAREHTDGDGARGGVTSLERRFARAGAGECAARLLRACVRKGMEIGTRSPPSCGAESLARPSALSSLSRPLRRCRSWKRAALGMAGAGYAGRGRGCGDCTRSCATGLGAECVGVVLGGVASAGEGGVLCGARGRIVAGAACAGDGDRRRKGTGWRGLMGGDGAGDASRGRWIMMGVQLTCAWTGRRREDGGCSGNGVPSRVMNAARFRDATGPVALLPVHVPVL